MIRATVWLVSLTLALISGFLVFRIAQNQATRAWSAGQREGYLDAQHEVAVHWYRRCLEENAYEDEHIDWHPHCDQIFEYQLGFKNRWRGEMP